MREGTFFSLPFRVFCSIKHRRRRRSASRQTTIANDDESSGYPRDPRVHHGLSFGRLCFSGSPHTRAGLVRCRWAVGWRRDVKGRQKLNVRKGRKHKDQCANDSWTSSLWSSPSTRPCGILCSILFGHFVLFWRSRQTVANVFGDHT